MIPEGPPEIAASVVPVPPAPECWRCRMCGKWSHAKRRPVAHVRMVIVREQDPKSPFTHPTSEPGFYKVYCGPFDRYALTEAEPPPRPALMHFGKLMAWARDPYHPTVGDDDFPF